MRLFLLIVVSLVTISLPLSAFDKNYTDYNQVINDNVKNGRVDYAQIKKDLHNLVRFLNEVSRVSREEFDGFNRNEQIAFLINYYNAGTIKLVMDNYPVKSAKDIRGQHDKKFLPLFDKEVSLEYIYNDLLRKNYNDPRIHFALARGSVCCPQLLHYAYTGSRLNELLDKQAEKFILKSPQINYYDAGRNRLYVSNIFKSYKKDFVRHSGSVKDYLRQYFPDLPQKFKLKYTDFDWTLNCQ